MRQKPRKKPRRRRSQKREQSEEIKQILDKMSVTIFQYITQGLFKRHRLIAASELAFKFEVKGELDAQSLDHLLRDQE